MQGPYPSTCLVKSKDDYSILPSTKPSKGDVLQGPSLSARKLIEKGNCDTPYSERRPNQAPLRKRSRKESKQGELPGYAERYAFRRLQV